MDDRTAHVRNSVTFRSLVLETRVRDTLRRLGWTTALSAHYTDIKTGVEREFDIAATRNWKRTRKRSSHTVTVNVLASCKSRYNGAAILVGAREQAVSHTYHQWLGIDDDAHRAQLRLILTQAGLGHPEADRIMDRFAEATHPEGRTAIITLLANALPAPFYALTAREARGSGNDDKNFVWDATRETFAAINGVTAENFADLADELGFEIAEVVEGADVEDAAFERLLNAASSVDLYHPVIVTDAKLFELTDDEQLLPLTWARVEQTRLASRERRWIDLVDAEAFPEYAASLSAWYERWFAKQRAEPA